MVHLVRVRVVQPMTLTRFSITVCSSDLKSRSAQVKIEAPKIAIESISIGNHYKCLGIGSLTNRSHGAVPTFHVNRSRRTQIKGIKFDHNKCNYRSATLISLCQVVICAPQRTDSRNRHHRLALERCKNLYLMYATCHWERSRASSLRQINRTRDWKSRWVSCLDHPLWRMASGNPKSRRKLTSSHHCKSKASRLHCSLWLGNQRSFTNKRLSQPPPIIVCQSRKCLFKGELRPNLALQNSNGPSSSH
jgi:hypothetical protein